MPPLCEAPCCDCKKLPGSPSNGAWSSRYSFLYFSDSDSACVTTRGSFVREDDECEAEKEEGPIERAAAEDWVDGGGREAVRCWEIDWDWDWDIEGCWDAAALVVVLLVLALALAVDEEVGGVGVEVDANEDTFVAISSAERSAVIVVSYCCYLPSADSPPHSPPLSLCVCV